MGVAAYALTGLAFLIACLLWTESVETHQVSHFTGLYMCAAAMATVSALQQWQL